MSKVLPRHGLVPLLLGIGLQFEHCLAIEQDKHTLLPPKSCLLALSKASNRGWRIESPLGRD